MEWGNTPNKRNRIGGNNINNNQLNQKPKLNNTPNQQQSTPQQKKPWINFNKNRNQNNNFNRRRSNQNNQNKVIILLALIVTNGYLIL